MSISVSVHGLMVAHKDRTVTRRRIIIYNNNNMTVFHIDGGTYVRFVGLKSVYVL